MKVFYDAYLYFIGNIGEFLIALKDHLLLSAIALLAGMIICIPLGIFLSRRPEGRRSTLILNAIYIGRIIPSLAVLALAIPYIGIGFKPSLIALILLVCPPILINTVTAFKELDKNVIEAANGMGMEKKRVLFRVEIPLALPIIIAGIRTSSVEVIASATLAAFIGGGGLGIFILNGIAMAKYDLLLVGAIPVALLAIIVEVLFGTFEKMVSRFKTV